MKKKKNEKRNYKQLSLSLIAIIIAIITVVTLGYRNHKFELAKQDAIKIANMAAIHILKEDNNKIDTPRIYNLKEIDLYNEFKKCPINGKEYNVTESGTTKIPASNVLVEYNGKDYNVDVTLDCGKYIISYTYDTNKDDYYLYGTTHKVTISRK